MFFTARYKAILALTIANILWGFASPIFKLALQNLPPFTLAYLRFFGAAILLLPFAINKLKVDRKDWSNLLLLSFFGITVNITFFFLGLEKAPSINAPIIASSAPVFLFLSSILFLKEKPKRKVLIGIILSLLGILVIVGQPLIETGMDGNLLGNFYFVLATIGAVGHAIFSKKIMDKYSAVTITFWSFLLSSFTFLPQYLYEMIKYQPFNALDYKGIIGLVYGIVFSSALAYFLFEWGVQKIQAQEVGLFTYIDPIAAILLAIPLLGETVTPVYLIGALLVFGGIFLAEGRLHWHPIHKLRN